MKNIHMFPTKKPSRLFMCFGKLNIGDYIAKRKHPNVENQYIYITSDEEIKEMDWFYDIRKPDTPINRRFINTIMDENCKKIILTDRSTLIENGVQAIDDEFLEWFVKNPSCEKVEINYQTTGLKEGIWQYYYKIIIPKEEPQQEILLGKTISKKDADKDSFEDVTKYKKERSYSEVDMKSFALQCVANFILEISLVEVIIDRNNEQFEKFKNK